MSSSNPTPLPTVELSEFAQQHVKVARHGHELERARALRAIRTGETNPEFYSDAGSHLINSADVLGTPAPYACPVCRGQKQNSLKIIHWIHGVGLAEMSGTARTLNEIRMVVDNFVSQHLNASHAGHDGGAADDAEKELSIHTVEVCLHCKWNYLLREDIVRVQDL